VKSGLITQLLLNIQIVLTSAQYNDVWGNTYGAFKAREVCAGGR
jgi:hypothetical protein